tara:strand:+ start:1483 stop:2448 length:966 start_codon:yes stop_codon:yes gene_type:complete
MKFRFPFLLVLSCLASCESKEAPIRHESIVVYASYSDESYLPELFAEFTDETGIPVTVTYDGSDVHTRNLIFNIGSPPADVFLSRSVADLWRAADEGALRPIAAANLEQVPEALRDLDGLWTAVNYQQSVIAYRGDLDEPLPRGLVDLGDEKYRGRLCVSSAGLPANRLILSMMIADLGQKQAERVVRHWMQNLAEGPFESDEALMSALDRGVCDLAIVSGWTAGTFLQSQADLAIRAIHPQPAYTQIEGIGVARHSRYPDSAQQLVNWMLSKTVNQQHARNVNAIPAIGTPLAPEVGQAPAVAGWNNEEARSLAERAGYR